eukprot:843117-Pleurochrysis_carterae.AAC.1
MRFLISQLLSLQCRVLSTETSVAASSQASGFPPLESVNRDSVPVPSHSNHTRPPVEIESLAHACRWNHLGGSEVTGMSSRRTAPDSGA